MLRWYSEWKFSFLAAALIGLVGFQPFLEGVGHHRVLLQVLNSVVMIAILLAFARDRRMLATLLLLGSVSLVGSWSDYFFSRHHWREALLIDRVATIAFLAITTGVILYRVIRERRVTTDTLLGSVSVYLLIAATWGSAYSALEYAKPGSFALSDESARRLQDPITSMNDWLYYSFMTLTTLGCDEIAPRSRPAGTLTWMEAMAGQFYLALLVARLVGLHMTRTKSTD